MQGSEVTNSDWRKRATVIFLGGLVLLLMTILIVLQSSHAWKLFPIDSADDTLALYALTSLNFFAFVVFAGIFLRSIFKLRRERKSLQLGARLKTRLLVYFIAVSLLPIVAMATFSYLFLNRALEKWFSALPETVIREAGEIQTAAITAQTENLLTQAKTIAVFLERQTAFDSDLLQQVIERGKLVHLEIVNGKGQTLAQSSTQLSSSDQRALNVLLKSARQEAREGVTPASTGNFVVTTVSLADDRRLLVVPTNNALTAVRPQISSSPGEFEKLKQSQQRVRQLGFSTLGLLTFLLIFAASWIAFYVGRGLTVPIRALAEASHEVARGNFEHRVDVPAEDELALLVWSFNRMTGELEENRRKLEERRRYTETVLQSLSTGVISLDGENQISTVNNAAREILRLPDQIGEEVDLATVANGENRAVFTNLIARARRVGHAAEQTVLWRAAENGNGSGAESLPVALAATALPDYSGDIGRKQTGVVIVVEDLSELLAAQRTAAWQEVARRMAHEIKNPLTPIQLAAERIAKRVQSPMSKVQGQTVSQAAADFGHWTSDFGQTTRVVAESTEIILREVAGLKAMVDEFSRFARLPRVQLQTGDLNDVVRQAVALYQDRLNGVTLDLQLAAELPPAMLDAEALRRVFVNLIDNAFEALSENQSDRQIVVATGYYAPRDVLVAEVADNGRGIAAGDTGKLFQPYFSTKGRGTGLGLAIVGRIIGEHGGRIRAVNQSQGARFVIQLPASSV